MAYYGQQSMQMGAPKYSSGDQAVNVMMPGARSQQAAPRWSWCSMGWAIFAWLWCGSICGFFGFVCSMLSYVDHKSRDYDRARYKRRCSWACTIFGILVSVVAIVVVIVLFVVYTEEMRKYFRDRGHKVNW